jgi:hypothetical protein
MRSCDLRFLVVPLLFFPWAVAKDKPPLPKLVVSAQYVLVTTECGDPAEQPLNPHIMPEDRQAVSDVQNAIEKWGRYSIAYRRQDADLILVVRKGRVAEGLLGAQVHAGSRVPNRSTQPDDIAQPGTPDPDNPCGARAGSNAPGTSVRPEATADLGDPQDMIVLYASALGTENNSPPLWRGRRPDGLKAPQMRLVQELRSKVEAAAKAP